MRFVFFPLPRNSPPGHFLFLVPASGHRRTGGRGSSQGSCPCKAFNRSRPLFFRQCAAFSDRAFSHPVRVQRALGYSAHFDFKLAPRTAIQALRPHCPDRRQNFHDSPLYGFAAFLAAFAVYPVPSSLDAWPQVRISFPVFPQLLPRCAPGKLRRRQAVAAVRHHRKYSGI